jgi:molecular chaperone GrpE
MTSDKRGRGGNGTDPDTEFGNQGSVAESDSSFADPRTLPVVEAPEEELERLRTEVAEKTAEAAQNYDRFVRERADLENYKRRAQRERSESLRFGAEALVRDLLVIVDNLERAVEHAEASGQGEQIVQGVRLVLKGALDVLARHGVTRIDATGQPFDPAFHEAIAQVQDDQVPANHVVQQFQPGYRLHDRLLRPAQVSVSGGPSKIAG